MSKEQRPFIHERALCESEKVGEGTRVWAFAHILPGAQIGADCNICDGVFIENDVIVGDRVTIKCGVQLWDGVRIADDVFIGPNATFTNDRFPRSKARPEAFAQTIIGKGASIGANATILPGLEIGSGAMIGAGAVVTRSVPANAIVVGNPARISGYVNAHDHQAPPPRQEAFAGQVADLGVGGCQLHAIRRVRDLRGSLAVAEIGQDLPFVVNRFFVVYDVPSREVRGEHAHRRCAQFLICLHGSVHVLLDDGSSRRDLVLDSPEKGLYMAPMIWGAQYRYTDDAVLLVLASEPYDANDYIRSYEQYLEIKRAGTGEA
jgi:UDP-2-acetamido-3-amino-2,3-dideoxy-glucuronate N-acetyltransferase